MNRSFRHVWSAVQQRYTVAPETAHCNGGPCSKVAAAVLVVAALGPSASMAAEVVNYPGQTLQTILGNPNSLGPSSTSVTGNTINITASDPVPTDWVSPNWVVGAAAISGTLEGNTVNMTGGSVTSRLVGAWSPSTGSVFGNSVVVNSGSITGDGLVLGGHTQNGSASNNTVTINNGTLAGTVWGAYSRLSVSDNTATINNGTINGAVFGAWTHFSIASGNSAVINGGTIGNNVYGAYASEGGNAISNTATINGGTVGGDVYGGSSYYSSAADNTANINGGTVSGNVYGGSSFTASNNNSVNIRGGTVNGNVFGGAAVTGNATGNTVSISGSPVFGGNTILYGGTAGYGVGDVRTGNLLALHTSGVTVRNIHNFETLHFYLPSTTTNGTTVLTLTDPSGADIRGSSVGVGLEGGTAPLYIGDKVTLIRADGGLATDANNLVNTTTGMQGISLLYEFDLQASPTTLDAIVTSGRLNPQTKSLLEGRLAGLSLVNQGADLAAGEGLDQAVKQAQKGGSFFMALSGGKSRYKTGSHVDLTGASILAGVAAQLPNSSGQFTLGGFLEAGRADYDSSNSFDDAPSVYAEGDVRYYGAGLLGQQDFSNNWYVQGSARAGKLKTSYRSADLQNYLGQGASYDSDRSYTGLHLGLGHVLPMGQTGDSLNLYGKIFWNRTGSDTQTILGDTFSFDSLESLRSRLGMRYTHKLNNNGSVYGGLAWEHEYRGVARGKVYGLSMLEPRLRGSSGMLEAGVKFSPEKNKNLTLEVGLQGYAGKRQGVLANARLKYAF